MVPRNGYKQDVVKISLDRALNILGDSFKRAIIFYMTEYYGISWTAGKCSVSDIESALKSMLGEGSKLITDRMYKELESMNK
jgi:hypothetical protein